MKRKDPADHVMFLAYIDHPDRDRHPIRGLSRNGFTTYHVPFLQLCRPIFCG